MQKKENKEMGKEKIRDYRTDKDRPNNTQNKGKPSKAEHTSIKKKNQVSTIHSVLKKFSNLPISILKRLRSYETLLLVINLTGIILTGFIFFSLTNQGLERINAIVRINKPVWLKTIDIAYTLTWVQIGFCILNLYIRRYIRKKMVVPVTQREKLEQKQIFGDQKVIANQKSKKKKPSNTENDKKQDNVQKEKRVKNYVEKEEKAQQKNRNSAYRTLKAWDDAENYIRDTKMFYILNLILFGLLIGYLNYFPRGLGLFSSYWEDTEANPDLGFILQPSEFFTFFIVNIMWCVVIFMTFLFFLSFILRKIKDINTTIEFQAKKDENRKTKRKMEKQVEENWKPPLPKPWEAMNLQERKEYQLLVLKKKKEYIQKKEKQELKQLLQEEKLKQKLGIERYKRKKKEEERKRKAREKRKKQKQARKKESLEKEINKYDFR